MESTPHCHTAIECEGTDTQSEYFKEVCSEFDKKQVINDKLSAFIEQSTTGQSECQLWKMLRNGRITSSFIGEMMHRKDSTDPTNILISPVHTSVSGSKPI